MITEYYEIKDNCRKELLIYLSRAISVIPDIPNPKILDIGCGTGVPTLWFAEKYYGTITAIDSDTESLKWLLVKIDRQNLSDRIEIVNRSFFDTELKENEFDIILAEGFLNAVGFQPGFLEAIKLLKSNGFFIIHDEYRDHNNKCDFIVKNNCKILESFVLDENVWWNYYYKQLEEEIFSPRNAHLADFFKSDIQEIETYKTDSALFKSIYYIIKKS